MTNQFGHTKPGLDVPVHDSSALLHDVELFEIV
jgi:hypothetical protein